MRRIAVAIAAIGLAMGLYLAHQRPDKKGVQPSEAKSFDSRAPVLTLVDLRGDRIDTSSYAGDVVLVNFWAAWCTPCAEEVPQLVALQDKYRAQGFRVIGISMEDRDGALRDFYRKYRMNYPVVAGSAKIAEAYGGILGLPTTFLIGRDGRIYAKHEGAMDVSVFEEEVKQLLALPASAEAANFQQEGPRTSADQIELGDPKTIDSEVPGLDLTKLTAEQKEAFKKVLAGQQCTCGCKMNLLKCRQVDRQCAFSLKLARAQLDKFLKPTV